MSNKDDASTHRGATALCHQIEQFWKRRGFHGIRARTFELYPGEGLNTWAIRSNIGPTGFPPREVQL